MNLNQKVSFAQTVQEYEVEAEVSKRDLSDFLDKLLESGLVRVVEL